MKKFILSLFLIHLVGIGFSQNEKPVSSINFEIGTNAFVFDDELGFFMGLGYEYYWLRPFSTEIRFQTGRSTNEQYESIVPESVVYTDDYVLQTEVNYFSFSLFPRYYQQLSDVIYFFVDAGFGIESSKSNATFINQAKLSDETLDAEKASAKIYPGLHLGFKIVGDNVSGSFYVGYERLQLDRSLNKLDIEQTGVFNNYTKKTSFPQLGLKISIPLTKKQWRYNPDASF